MDLSTALPSRRADAAALPWQTVILLTLLAAVLRFYGINAFAFWKNELFSLYWSRHSAGFLLTQGLLQETNPPLHFLALKAWIALFGESEFAVRALSALASVAAVPLVYLTGRTLAGSQNGGQDGHRIGLLAALLLAVSPVQVFLGQEARVYAFLPLFIMAAMLGLWRFLKTPGSLGAGLPLYTAAAVALLYSHGIAPFLMLAFTLSVLPALRARPRRILALLGANGFAAVCGLPVLLAMAAQSASPNLDWITRLSAHTPLTIGHFLVVGPMIRQDLAPAAGEVLLFTGLALGLAVPALMAVFARRAIPDRDARALVLLAPAIFLLLVTAVSLVRPILEPRIIAWFSVPLCLAAAFLLIAPATAWLRKPAALLLIGSTAIGLADSLFFPAQPYPDWRAFVRDADPANPASPMLIAAPHVGPLGVAFYTPGGVRAPLRQWTLTPGTPLSNADRLGQSVAGAAPITTDAIATLIRAGAHPHLFLDATDQVKLGPELAELPDFLAARRQSYPGLTVYSW